MESRVGAVSMGMAVFAAILLVGCPAEDKTTVIYQLPAPPGHFPGTPASVSNLAEDAKALSPGGQDVTAVRVFWDGHDTYRAIVLFETRVFLTKGEYQFTQPPGPPPLPARMTTWTQTMYYRHLWATYFNGATLSKPVEIVGKGMDLLAITESFVSVDINTQIEVEREEPTPWRNLIDTAAVLFYRSSPTGAFDASGSSPTAAVRQGDAVIFFRARDVDTDPGIASQDMENERIAWGNNSIGPYGGNLARGPITGMSVSITDGTETFTDDGNGNLTGSLGGTGFIDYFSGGFVLTFNQVVPPQTPILCDYTFEYFADNANERLYTAYFDFTQSGVERAQTQDVVGTGAGSERVFRWGFTEEADPVSDEVAFPTFGTTAHEVSSFGLLADGFLGQAWWGADSNEMDNAATFTHFLVAVWTEMTGGYASARGVLDKFFRMDRGLQESFPDNEIDRKLMAAVFDVETGTFGPPQEISLDAQATENNSGIPAWIQSPGDSFLHEQFITYDNQIFFTYMDAAVDDDPYTTPNYDVFQNGEGLDSILNWNRFVLTTNTTSGAGAFLTSSIRLSPGTTSALIGVDIGGNTGQNMPNTVWETTNELKNENDTVVFGADEGLGSTYIFFTEGKILIDIFTNPSPPPPIIALPRMVDDNDLFVAQVRHTQSGAAVFTPSEDRLEVDTLGDMIPVVAEDNSAMDFSAGPDPFDFRLLIGNLGGGPVFDEFPVTLLTVGGATRIAFRNPNPANNTGVGGLAYRTLNSINLPYDQDFPSSVTDDSAEVEDGRRSVLDDWRIVLNSSTEYFLILYRQQDRSNQSLGTFGSPTAVVMSHLPDIGLYASRLTTVLAGNTPQPLSGLAEVGLNAVRLDADTSTTDPTSGNYYREDAVAFQAQREIDPLFHVQSDPTRISVLYLTILDDNSNWDDARNTPSGDHSFDMIRVVQVENTASGLSLHPAAGGVEVARYPFNYFTVDNAGTVHDNEDFYEAAAVMDAGANGDAMVYYIKPTEADVQIVGIYVPATPAGQRLFAANFTGSSSVTERQISTTTSDPSKAQALGFLAPITRGISAVNPNGLHHMILWIEDRTQSANFIGGGALMSLRYNKQDDTFTPSITGTGWPVQADFAAGDSLSFPVGYGMDQTTMALYFTQFGEIYYTEYYASVGRWWEDAYGLPAPTLVSNEGFPGMPNAFMRAFSGQDTAMFGANVFGNYFVQEFTATVGASNVTVRRYDSMRKALVFYAKDDGGWDPENDGTGYNRLFCRIRE
ncbi:MAG: hypothetical protein ACYTHN_03215 [Planctomycetota bacterium]